MQRQDSASSKRAVTSCTKLGEKPTLLGGKLIFTFLALWHLLSISNIEMRHSFYNYGTALSSAQLPEQPPLSFRVQWK